MLEQSHLKTWNKIKEFLNESQSEPEATDGQWTIQKHLNKLYCINPAEWSQSHGSLSQSFDLVVKVKMTAKPVATNLGFKIGKVKYMSQV